MDRLDTAILNGDELLKAKLILTMTLREEQLGVENFAKLFELPAVSELSDEDFNFVSDLLGADYHYALENFIFSPTVNAIESTLHSLFRKIGLNFFNYQGDETRDTGFYPWEDMSRWLILFLGETILKMNGSQRKFYIETIEHYFANLLYEIDDVWLHVEMVLGKPGQSISADNFELQNSFYYFIEFNSRISEKILNNFCRDAGISPGHGPKESEKRSSSGSFSSYTLNVAQDFHWIFPDETQDFNPDKNNIFRYGIVNTYFNHLDAVNHGLTDLSCAMERDILGTPELKTDYRYPSVRDVEGLIWR